MKKLEKFIIYAIEIIFTLILVFLTIESIIKTCIMTKDETTIYLWDNPIIHIITVSITIGIFIFLNKKKINLDKKVLWILIGLWTLFSLVWIYLTDLYPRVDQKYIYEIALQMRDGIFNGFETGKYAFLHPHQYGLILFEYIFALVFGTKTYLVLQIVNVAAVLASFFAIYKITRIIFKNKETYIATIFGLFLFIPLWFYITFIYGTLIGLAASMIAVWFTLEYLDSKKVRYIVLASISISLAILFKSNYLIMLIAIICILILDAISNKKIINIIPIAIILCMYLVFKTALPITMKTITGVTQNKGIPMISYIEMGFQEGKRAPGWYNKYNKDVYVKNGYNYEIAEKQVKEDLGKSLEEFKNNPTYAIKFFYEKTVSQWNNPTFQGLWVNKARNTGSGKEKFIVARALFGENIVSNIASECMNIIQTIILFGATAFMIINFKKNNVKQLSFAIIFIGGFLFHLIWEAKCQYTITYFVLLIPYAIKGYIQLANIIQKRLDNKNIK